MDDIAIYTLGTVRVKAKVNEKRQKINEKIVILLFLKIESGCHSQILLGINSF